MAETWWTVEEECKSTILLPYTHSLDQAHHQILTPQLQAAGKIEWHIPTVFTAERPPITYKHVAHSIPASQHPAASKIPSVGSLTKPTVVSDPDEMADDLAWAAGHKPGGISDYVDTDKPVLGLRVNSFTDKTVVVISWQHVTFDALGMQYVVQNWSKMLHGQESEVPTPCAADGVDPFLSLATGSREPTEQHILMDKKVGMGGMLKWGLGYGVDMLVRAKENRMICLPQVYWQTQLDKALEELRAEARQKGEDESKVFLTEGDILAAWTLRTVVASLPNQIDPERTVAASIAMSLRKAFEGDLIPVADDHPYVGNAFGWANVLVKARDLSEKPLSWLAREVRRAINEQGTRAQHEAYYAMVRQGPGLPIVIFGDGGMFQVGFSNWSKAGLFDLDFSPARVTPKEGTCRPVYVQENHGPIKPVDGWFVFGKDERGNYWTSACKVKGQWPKMEEFMNNAA